MTSDLFQILNFMDGEFKPSLNSETLENIDPTTGKAYSVLPKSDVMDAVFAIKSSKKAFERWSVLPAEERVTWLNKIADGIESKFEEFAMAESQDTGKPLWLTRSTDIPSAIESFRFYASRAVHHLNLSFESKDLVNHVNKDPLGVCILITPFSAPLSILAAKLAPCLVTGNVAICKPSELAPMTSFLLAKVFEEIKLPKGVCNILFGLGADVAEPLVEHPGVAAISFTGHPTTGKRIASLAAADFKKLNLELGGKNSAIILKDADLKKAVDTCIISSFLSQGQNCFSTERIFVQNEVFEDFKRLFISEVEKLQIGDPKNETTFMGPLISKAKLDKNLDALQLAKKEKAKILYGGEVLALEGQGYFIQPTVMEDLSDCSELQQEEIFGPVASLRSFKYAHEAVKLANTTPYGLCATLFTEDITKAQKLIQNLNVGTVWINTWLKKDLRAPMGGMKSSGHGREGGDGSLDFFTDSKNVILEV